MNESRWTCKRCAREFDLEMGEGWIALAEEIPSPEHCKLSPTEPYETVCYECADELYAIVEKCNQDCTNCEAPKSWGLSIRDCLKFQQKFGFLNLPLPQGQVPVLGSLYEAEDVLRVFKAV